MADDLLDQPRRLPGLLFGQTSQEGDREMAGEGSLGSQDLAGPFDELLLISSTELERDPDFLRGLHADPAPAVSLLDLLAGEDTVIEPDIVVRPIYDPLMDLARGPEASNPGMLECDDRSV